ncbi:MAG: hypothetical protein ACI9XO_004929 [Paraglaciecola sp.]|jgi:hypothetical protein
MKHLIILNRLLLLLILLSCTWQIQGQSEKELLAQLAAEEQEAVNALVLYPKETRQTILETALFPETLIKMESIQLQTSTKFKELMQAYPQEVQEMVWDLTRYPGLLEQLVTSNLSGKSMNEILAAYPSVIHPRAKQAATNNQALIAEINQLNRAASAAFTAILQQYPPTVQANLQKLLDLPEVLTLLTENIRVTLLVGDLYKKEPDWIVQKVDSVSLKVARQNAQEIEDWKENLANNPQVMEELKASTESFNDDYNYDDTYYDFDNKETNNPPDYRVVNTYYEYNYPYWFGYPYWYSAPRWRLNPYWYDCGYYYGSGGSMVVIGLPSFYFVNWYFYYPSHHVYWSNLSANFVRHHNRHPHQRNSVTSGVDHWHARNREVVTDQWMKDDKTLSTRMQEYGKFETARTKYNGRHSDKPLTQNEYAERKTRRYPTVTQSAKEVEKSSPKPVYKIPPSTQNRKDRKVNKPTITKPKTQPRRPSKVKTPKMQQSSKTIPKVNRAKKFHKDTWEQSQPSNNKVTRPTIPQRNVRKTTNKNPKRKTIPKKKKDN